MKNAVRTAAVQTGSIVKRSRSQSQEQPMMRSCSTIVDSYSSFHSWTLATNSSRLKSVRRFPWRRSRFSTTAWVAMPA